MLSYVTYDGAGALTGGYLQDLAEQHVTSHIGVSDEQRMNWPRYRANAARDALVLLEPSTAPQVPQEVTRRQAIQQMYLGGITEAMVEDYIGTAVTDETERALALIEFRTAAMFERNNWLVAAAGAAMGLNLDDLFISAAKL
jgi:hypothetical protein